MTTQRKKGKWIFRKNIDLIPLNLLFPMSYVLFHIFYDLHMYYVLCTLSFVLCPMSHVLWIVNIVHI